MHKLIFKILFFPLLIIHFSLFSIEVGGHLTEDTTWSPENNPYIVTEHLFVDEGVTLRILPGTRVKAKTKQLTEDNFYYPNWYDAVDAPRLIMIEGTLIAEGTESDSIYFDRYEDEFMRRWGGIRLYEYSVNNRISYCSISNCVYVDYPSYYTGGGLGVMSNDMTIIKNNSFKNCQAGLIVINDTNYIESCVFGVSDEYFDDVANCNKNVIVFGEPENNNQKPIIFSQCIFKDYNTPYPYSLHDIGANFINNRYINLGRNITNVSGSKNDQNLSLGYRSSDNNYLGVKRRNSRNNYTINYYGNSFINCKDDDHFNVYATEGDTAYISHNFAWIDTMETDLNYCSIEYNGYGELFINNNNFRSMNIKNNSNSTILNINTYCNSLMDRGTINLYADAQTVVYNNICNNGQVTTSGSARCLTFNNSFKTWGVWIYAIWGFGENESEVFNNALIMDVLEGNKPVTNLRDELNYYYNCLRELVNPFPYWNDLGGNIISDPLLNPDMSLSENSPCIDAGYQDSLLIPMFDIYGNVRTVDGDGNGEARVDIGAIEYNSEPLLCGIEGTVINMQTGEPVQACEVKISGRIPEWSDSTGYFRFNIPPGEYNLTFKHPWYDTEIERNIPVNMGNLTELFIDLNDLYVSTYPNNEIPEKALNLTSYPNPFQASDNHRNIGTTISFFLPKSQSVSVDIYNIKGQKVKKLHNGVLEKGLNKIQWFGKNEQGKAVATGVYFYKVRFGKQSSVRKMLLLK